ncbi:SDR family NAD(P)-dependent oxidoreductase [Actinacidiphila sp. DG2A-62]|uniref:SDR family NAD(P)-dependent oxidoreductase n=1 Tax=Actinacidiphila sp. DG2A-62 TaxID=3108821 RepID=UPI002DBFB839|nr:SDR family NAD(P)-dependent oxidoreductase [Actinacidiphila sp. DG2A-62]MEC3994456.1 SDR family NAD(P)-dependent oxidoreductase [Actinacidiphila sp. DG2A-62]
MNASTTTITLVTGANKGIGREIAGQLAALGHTVVVAARSAERGEQAARELREAGGDATSVVLDVTDAASVAAAADTVEKRYGRLDVLVNNAGISRPNGGGLVDQQPGTVDVDTIRTIFETNVFGVIAVTEAMLPLLRRSDAPRVVNVSSSAGSLAGMADMDAGSERPIAVGYAPSKTTETAVTLQYARALKPENILVNAVCPGFVATDLNNFAGHRTPAQGAVAAVRMATVGPDGPTGTFTDEDGPAPW